MSQRPADIRFKAPLQEPADPGDGEPWGFVMLPRQASEALPRRGRTTVAGAINGVGFQQTLEPDGQLGHWLRVDGDLRKATGAAFGAVVNVEIAPVEEPDPEVPADFREALDACPRARATWDDTTTIARLDWIHWMTSARQAKTRARRVAEACDKLAAGQRRVCCFDPSGFYSKAFKPPKPAT